VDLKAGAFSGKAYPQRKTFIRSTLPLALSEAEGQAVAEAPGGSDSEKRSFSDFEPLPCDIELQKRHLTGVRFNRKSMSIGRLAMAKVFVEPEGNRDQERRPPGAH
jgi:hypothetical protein